MTKIFSKPNPPPQDFTGYPTCEVAPQCEASTDPAEPAWYEGISNYQDQAAEPAPSFSPPPLWRPKSSKASPHKDDLQLLGLPLFLFFLPTIRETIESPAFGFAISPQELKKTETFLEQHQRIGSPNGHRLYLKLFSQIELGPQPEFYTEVEIGADLTTLAYSAEKKLQLPTPPRARFGCAVNLAIVYQEGSWTIDPEDSTVTVLNGQAAAWPGHFKTFALTEMEGLSLEPNGFRFVWGDQSYAFTLKDPGLEPLVYLELLYGPEELTAELRDFYLQLKTTDPSTWERLNTIINWSMERSLPDMACFFLERLPSLPESEVTRMVNDLYRRATYSHSSPTPINPQTPRALEIFRPMADLLSELPNLGAEDKKNMGLLEERALAADWMDLDPALLPSPKAEAETPYLLAHFEQAFTGEEPPSELLYIHQGILFRFRASPLHLPSAKNYLRYPELWHLSLDLGDGWPSQAQDIKVFHYGRSFYFATQAPLEGLIFKLDHQGKLYCLQGEEAFERRLRPLYVVQEEILRPPSSTAKPPIDLAEFTSQLDRFFRGLVSYLGPTDRPVARVSLNSLVEQAKTEPETLLAHTVANWFSVTMVESFPGDAQDAEAVDIYLSHLINHPDPDLKLSLEEANDLYIRSLEHALTWQGGIVSSVLNFLLEVWEAVFPQENIEDEKLKVEVILEDEAGNRREAEPDELKEILRKVQVLGRTDRATLIFYASLGQGIEEIWQQRGIVEDQAMAARFMFRDMLRERESRRRTVETGRRGLH